MTRDHYKILKDIYTSAGMDVPVITEECAKKLGLEITDRGIAPLQGNNDDNIISEPSNKKPSIPIECYKVVKKSRYSKLQEQLNKLENKFDILDDDLLEFKWEIDDIKKTLSLIKSSNTKSFKNSETLSESDLSDNIKYHILHS